jgi:bis(5'-nucleosidyl)-tetraphosphatase
MGEDWQALLIQHHAGHWSFPKGHAEGGESPLETAGRELKEETNLEIVRTLLDNSLSEEYSFKRDGHLVHKKVTYFVAEVTGDLRLQDDEIEEASWLSLDQLEGRATFEEAKRLCRRLQQTLGGVT